MQPKLFINSLSLVETFLYPFLIHFLPMSTFATVLLKFWFKKRRDHEKNSYERRAYESEDDKSLS